MESIEILAPAKINLTLDILGVREDSYHLLEMVMQTINIYDKLTITKNNCNKIVLTCNNKDIPTDGKNIVVKVANAFFNYTKIHHGIDIFLEKNIPSQAGLGGGSADGAATLKALNKLFNTKIPPKTLAKIGGEIGADIPFCIFGGTAIVSGIGEIVKPIKAFKDCHIVVAKPSINVNTTKAYDLYDNLKIHSNPKSNMMINAIENADLINVSKCLGNSFQEALQIKEVTELCQLMSEYGALNAIMTGSGSAVFGIFKDVETAINCYNKLSKLNKTESFLCMPVS